MTKETKQFSFKVKDIPGIVNDATPDKKFEVSLPITLSLSIAGNESMSFQIEGWNHVIVTAKNPHEAAKLAALGKGKVKEYSSFEFVKNDNAALQRFLNESIATCLTDQNDAVKVIDGDMDVSVKEL